MEVSADNEPSAATGWGELLDKNVPIILVLLLTTLLYAWSFPGSFHIDDYTIVKQNPLVEHLSLAHIFTADYWGAIDNSGLYRPLTILSLAINRQFFGSQPWGFIAVNLFIFLLIVFLLYQLLLRWTSNATLAILAVSFFAVHPIHAEVINTAVGRSELLVAMFVLLGLLLAEMHVPWASGLVVVCYAGAFLSKEHGVVFPLLLLATDVFRRRPVRQCLSERWKLYLALALVCSGVLALRAWGVDHAGLQRSAPNPIHMPLAYLDTSTRLGAAALLQVKYLYNLLFPLDLQAGYGGQAFLATVMEKMPLKLAMLSAFIVGSGTLWVRGWVRGRVYALLMLLYVISFAVTANLLVVIGVTFSDRLAFLPSAWFCSGLAVPCAGLIGKANFRRASIAAALLVLVLLAGLCVRRNLEYGHPERLWKAVVVAQSDNVEAWLYLADAQMKRADMVAAGNSYSRLVALAPRFEQGLTAYAEYLLNSKDPQQAAVYARKAVHANVGVTYPLARLVLARALLQLGQARAALEELSRTQNLFLSYGVYWETQGRALEQLGDHLGAINAYQKEEAVYFPETSDVLMREGEQLLALKQYRAAEEQYRREIDRHAGAAAWDGLGVALALQHRYDEAESAFRTATLKSPEILQYQNNLREVVRRRMNGGE